MPHVFLDGWAKPLLALHAVLAFGLLGACALQAMLAIRILRGRPDLGRLARLYSWATATLFAAAFTVGLLMYPHYRYHVRGQYLDRHAVFYSNLFDMKENLVSLALPLALGLGIIGGRLDPERDRAVFTAYAVLSLGVPLLVGLAVVGGLLVTHVRAV